MRISAMAFPALLCAPIALFALAAVASRSGIGRSEKPLLQLREDWPSVERIPLRAGGVRMGEERTFSRLPPGVPSGARDLMFREADRVGLQATQPFSLGPQAPPKISSPDEYSRFLLRLRSAVKMKPDEYRRFLHQLRSGQGMEPSSRYQLVRRSANKF